MKFRSMLLSSMFIMLMFVAINAQNHKMKTVNLSGKDYRVSENVATGSPHRIYGVKENYKNNGFKSKMTNTDILALSQRIVHDFKPVLKINSEQVQIKNVIEHGGYYSVSLEQTYNKIPVWGSEMGYTMDKDGNLISLGADIYSDLNIPTKPQLSKNDAIARVNQKLAGSQAKIVNQCDLYIYPLNTGTKPEFVLAWRIEVVDDIHFERYYCFINANTGETVAKVDMTRDAGFVACNLRYQYWPTNQNNPAQAAYLSNVQVDVVNTLGQYVSRPYTNAYGYFETPLIASSYYYVRGTLKNSYAEIRDRNVLAIDYIYNTNNTSPSQLVMTTYTTNPKYVIDQTWGACDGSNLYHHINYIHDYYKGTLGYNYMDYSMIATYDAGSYTNGSADGTNISFGAQNGQFWARSSDIIYHEYTHNVIYHIYGGWIGNDSYSQGRAMDEGLADFFSCSVTEDQYQGEACGVNRNMDNNYVFNPSQEAHWNGQVIGGACWDVRSAIGRSSAERLVLKALQISPFARNFTDFEENMLQADNILNNGANRTAIMNAFSRHSIAPETFASSMSGPSSLNEYQSGTWTVNLSGGVPPFTYRWSYYIPCANEPISQPSAAPCGYWFAMQEASNTLSRYDARSFELKCEVTDAIQQVTVASKSVMILSGGIEKKNNGEAAQGNAIPEKFELSNNYPNPFNPSTTIKFALPEACQVSLNIYDSMGRTVRELTNGVLSAGYHSYVFDANGLPSGIYFYRIIAGDKVAAKQMLLLK